MTFDKTLPDHLDHLDQVFRKLKERNISVSPKKSFIGYPCATLLGQKINAFGLQSTEERTKALVDMPFPRNLQELEHWIGATGFLQSKIPYYGNTAAMQFSVPVPEGEDTRTIPKRRRKSGNLTTAQREARKAAKRAEEAAQAAEAGDAGESAISRAPVEVVEEDDRLPWEDRKALPPISPIPSSSPVPIPWSPSPPRGPAPAQSTGSGEYCLVVGRESSNKAGTKIVNGRTVKLTPVERKEEQHQLSLITGRRLKANTPARFRHIKAVFEKKRAHENARWDGRRCDKFFRAIREVLDAVPFG